MAFTSLSTDIYLPAMPEMGRDLHGDAELTLTGFLIGFALAQLFWELLAIKLVVKAFDYGDSLIYHRLSRLCLEFIYARITSLARLPSIWCLRGTYVVTGYDS